MQAMPARPSGPVQPPSSLENLSKYLKNLHAATAGMDAPQRAAMIKHLTELHAQLPRAAGATNGLPPQSAQTPSVMARPAQARPASQSYVPAKTFQGVPGQNSPSDIQMPYRFPEYDSGMPPTGRYPMNREQYSSSFDVHPGQEYDENGEAVNRYEVPRLRDAGVNKNAGHGSDWRPAGQSNPTNYRDFVSFKGTPQY